MKERLIVNIDHEQDDEMTVMPIATEKQSVASLPPDKVLFAQYPFADLHLVGSLQIGNDKQALFFLPDGSTIAVKANDVISQEQVRVITINNNEVSFKKMDGASIILKLMDAKN